jgi:hypothetical protein
MSGAIAVLPIGCDVPMRLTEGLLATIHGLYVILSAAKNLTWNRDPPETLRCAQNDGSFPARKRLRVTSISSTLRMEWR